MSHFEATFARWVVKLRWVIIPVSLLLVFVATTGIRHLYFTTSYQIFFSEDNPQRMAFEAQENIYTKNDNVMIVLAPDNGDVFTRDTLAAIEELTEQAWQVPYSSRVDSVTNFQHTQAEGDDLTVRDLVRNAASLDDDQIQWVRDTALQEPLLLKRLVSSDGRVTAVNVTVQLPRIDEAKETPDVVAFVRELTAQFERGHSNIKTRLTGMVMMNNAFSELSLHDMESLVPASFAVMMVLIGVLVGGVTGTLATLLVIAFSILTAMGLGGHVGYPITPPSAAAPTIILTVAIANCVHLLVTFLYGLRHGKQKHAALEESLRVNLQPVFLASMTTVIGFLCMNFSEVPPFRHLGTITAFGVLSSFILSVTFLPALLAVLPVRVVEKLDSEDRAMIKLGDFVVRQRTRLLWGMTVAIVVLIANLPRNELNDIFLHYFDKSVAFRNDTDFANENLTGMYQISFSLDSGESGGVSEPGFLRDVTAFKTWLETKPEVMHVSAYTDIVKRLNKNMHGDDPHAYRLPQQRDLAAQYLLLYEMSLPYGLDLNNLINVDKSSTRVNVNTRTLSSNQAIALDGEATRWIKEHAPHIKTGTGSGAPLMFAYIGKRNIVSMLVGTSVALVLISILLVVALRSVKIGLVSLIPNLVPAAMGFGLWGIFVGQVGLSLSVVTTMTLGIVIDDTVHFLSKYLRARKEQSLNAADAVRYAFRTVGRALIITSVVLAAGFLVLSTSSFELNSGMGLLTAIVIALALAADFLLLPPLLITIEGDGDESAVPAGDTVTA